MRTAIGGALLLALAGCGANPEAQCKEAVATSCKKLFECWTTDAERMRLMLGATAEACTNAAQARCETPAVLCEKPRQWDGAAASQCNSEFAAIKCVDLRAGSTPSSCSNTCR